MNAKIYLCTYIYIYILNIYIYIYIYKCINLYIYIVAPRPLTLGHWQKGSLIHSMLIIALLLAQPKCYLDRSQALLGLSVGFEWADLKPILGNLQKRRITHPMLMAALLHIQFHWQFLIPYSGFWLVNILLQKFDTISKKEMKMKKSKIFR